MGAGMGALRFTELSRQATSSVNTSSRRYDDHPWWIKRPHVRHPRDANEFGDLAENASFVAPSISAKEMETEVKLLRSSRVLLKVINELGQAFDIQKSADLSARVRNWFGQEPVPVQGPTDAQKLRSLRDRLIVERDPLASTLIIGYRSTSPEKAAEIVSSIADVHLADRLAAKRDLFGESAKNLEQQVKKMAEWLRQEEGKIEEYRAENDLYVVVGSSPVEQRYSKLTEQLTEAVLTLTDAKARLSQVNGSIGDQESLAGIDLDSVREVQSAPVINDLRRQETEIQRRISDLKNQYGNNHPIMRNAQAELNGVRQSIKVEIRRIVDQLKLEVVVAENRVTTIQNQLDETESELSASQSKRIRLRELERDVAGPKRVYEMMLDRFQRAAEQEKLVTSTARVIGPAAVPDRKSNFSGLLMIILAATGAGATGVGLALAKEISRPGYNDARQLAADFDYPLLSILPRVSKKPKGELARQKWSTEAFGYMEAVRSTIQKLMLKRPTTTGTQAGRVIAITSCFSEEGKTTLAINLAKQASFGGLKTLVIEGDLRKEGMQLEFDTPDTQLGLIHLLKGEGTVDQAIHEEPSSGVHTILGLGPARDAFLLTRSTKLRNLINAMRLRYELIIIDCGPLLTISDTHSLVTMADEVLVAVRWQKTERVAVAACIDELERLETPIAGLVMTQVDLDEHMRYGHADSLRYHDRYQPYAINI